MRVIFCFLQDVIELVKAIAMDRVLGEAGGLQDFRGSGRGGNRAVRSDAPLHWERVKRNQRLWSIRTRCCRASLLDYCATSVGGF